MMFNPRYFSFAAIACLAFGATGCSFTPKKNLSLLSVGTSRDAIHREFGSPLRTVVDEGRTTDIYGFYQGYAKPVQATNSMVNGVVTATALVGVGALVIGLHALDQEQPLPYGAPVPSDPYDRKIYDQQKLEHDASERRRIDAENKRRSDATKQERQREEIAKRNSPEYANERPETSDEANVPPVVGRIHGFGELALSNPEQVAGGCEVIFAVAYDPALKVKYVDFQKGRMMAETGLTGTNSTQPPRWLWPRRDFPSNPAGTLFARTAAREQAAWAEEWKSRDQRPAQASYDGLEIPPTN